MRVVVLGLGYVGLVTGAGLAALGHEVVGVDVDAAKVDAVARGEAPFYEPGLTALMAEAIAARRLTATTSLVDAMRGAHVSLIGVGTPEGPDGADHSYLIAAAEGIGRSLAAAAPGHVAIVKSTVVPGTTDAVVVPAVARGAGLQPSAVRVAVNPEFLREGSAVGDFMRPDRIVVGASDAETGNLVASLYARLDAPVLVVGRPDAEAIKHTTNALLATMISFANEIAAICERTPGTDVEAVMDGLHLDRRLAAIGGAGARAEITSYLRAGFGFGGSCLPKDVAALRAHARRVGAATPLLDGAAATNAARPAQVVDLLAGALGGLPGKTVAVLGLAFKPGTDDVRRSPGLAIARALLDAGAAVRAHDPLLQPGLVPLDGRVDHRAGLAHALEGADAAMLATAWPEYAAADWDALLPLMRAPVLLDGRATLRGRAWPPGTRYLPIGRAPRQDAPA